MDAPCKGCTERHEICWEHCKLYKQYKDERNRIKKLIEEEKERNGYERQRRAHGKAIIMAMKKNKNNA